MKSDEKFPSTTSEPVALLRFFSHQKLASSVQGSQWAQCFPFPNGASGRGLVAARRARSVPWAACARRRSSIPWQTSRRAPAYPKMSNSTIPAPGAAQRGCGSIYTKKIVLCYISKRCFDAQNKIDKKKVTRIKKNLRPPLPCVYPGLSKLHQMDWSLDKGRHTVKPILKEVVVMLDALM